MKSNHFVYSKKQHRIGITDHTTDYSFRSQKNKCTNQVTVVYAVNSDQGEN